MLGQTILHYDSRLVKFMDAYNVALVVFNR